MCLGPTRTVETPCLCISVRGPQAAYSKWNLGMKLRAIGVLTKSDRAQLPPDHRRYIQLIRDNLYRQVGVLYVRACVCVCLHASVF